MADKHRGMYNLTNEELAKRFKNDRFGLVNYAISQAQDMIATHRPSRLGLPEQNVAYLTLMEMRAGVDTDPAPERKPAAPAPRLIVDDEDDSDD